MQNIISHLGNDTIQEACYALVAGRYPSDLILYLNSFRGHLNSDFINLRSSRNNPCLLKMICIEERESLMIRCHNFNQISSVHACMYNMYHAAPVLAARVPLPRDEKIPMIPKTT